MTDEKLLSIQKQLVAQHGHKVDVYHSEQYRGIIAVPHGYLLHPANVIAIYQY